jgi:hypothetical protein
MALLRTIIRYKHEVVQFVQTALYLGFGMFYARLGGTLNKANKPSMGPMESSMKTYW